MSEFEVTYRLPGRRERQITRVQALDSQQARRRSRAALGNDVSILRVTRVKS